MLRSIVRVLKSKCCEFHEDGSYATTIYIATMQEKNDFNVRVVGWRDVVSLALIFVVVSSVLPYLRHSSYMGMFLPCG
jgi:hypothetical protein